MSIITLDWYGNNFYACHRAGRIEAGERCRTISPTRSPGRGSLTKLESRIAAYLVGRPDAVLIETSAEIAGKLDVSPMTVTRFFKKLGFESSAEARSKAKTHLYGPAASRIGHRFDSFAASRADGEQDADLDVGLGAIRRALELRGGPVWNDIIRLVAESDSVHVIGFQTMRYLADGLCLRLGYVRGNVRLLDGGDGVYTGLLSDVAPTQVLVMMDVFRYGAHGPLLARAARERGVEVVVFCDEFCEWAASLTPHVLSYPSEAHFFMGLPTGIQFALNLLIQDVITRLGDKVREQIELLSSAQELFGQFIE